MNFRWMARQSALIALSAGLIGSLGACAAPQHITAEREQFNMLRDRYFNRVLELHPVTSLYLGGTGQVDGRGRLRDYRPEALASETAFFHELLRARAAIRPQMLGPDDQRDYASIGRQLVFIIQQLESARYYEKAVGTYVAEPYLGVRWQIQRMEEVEGGMRGTEAEWRLVLDRLTDTPSYLQAARTNLVAGKQRGNIPNLEMVQADGVEESRLTADFFRQTLLSFARAAIGNRPFAATLMPEMETAARSAGTAFDDFAIFLEQTYELSSRDERFVSAEPRASEGTIASREVAALYGGR